MLRMSEFGKNLKSRWAGFLLLQELRILEFYVKMRIKMLFDPKMSDKYGFSPHGGLIKSQCLIPFKLITINFLHSHRILNLYTVFNDFFKGPLISTKRRFKTQVT